MKWTTVIDDINDLKEGFNRVLHVYKVENIKIIKNGSLSYIEARIPTTTFYKEEDNIEILNDKTIMLFDIKDNYISPNNYKFLPKICYIIIVWKPGQGFMSIDLQEPPML